MKRKIFVLMLACVMVLGLLAGCSSDSGSSSSSGGNESSSDGGGSGDSGEEPGEIAKLVVAFATFVGAPADTLAIQEAMNEISREKIGVEVELLITDYASYKQQMTLMLTGNEPLDIMNTLGGLYVTSIQNGQLKDLEEDGLLETYGQGIIDAIGQEYIDACRVGGVLYGLPNNRDMAQGRGCAAIRTDLLEETGYEFQNSGEIEKISLEELNNIYAAIHELHPELEIYRPVVGSMGQFSNVDQLGGNPYGVLMDYGATLDVVNLFETDYYMEYCQRIHDYYNKGYISPDAATDSTAVTELVKAGTLASYTTGGKPGIKAQETNLCGYDMTIVQTLGDYIASSSVAGFPWTVPENNNDSVAAMKFLNLIYTDADMMNLISWGIEGQHYVINDEGFADFPEGVDATTSGYIHSMGWMFPNQFITHVWAGNDADLWDQIKTFNKEANKSAALGFAFDSTKVSTEYTAVVNVYEEYQKSIEYGLTDPTVAIPEMNERLKSAGMEIIINEKIEQLNQWAIDMGKA